MKINISGVSFTCWKRIQMAISSSIKLSKKFDISRICAFLEDIALIKEVSSNQIRIFLKKKSLFFSIKNQGATCYVKRMNAIQSVNDQTLLLFAHIKTILQNQNLLPFYLLKDDSQP